MLKQYLRACLCFSICELVYAMDDVYHTLFMPLDPMLC
jgi:hypothetical protein